MDLKILVDCDIRPIYDFECDETTARNHCNDLIQALMENYKKYQEGLMSEDDWLSFKTGYFYELQDYQAYMREKDWGLIPELPHSFDE